MANLIAIRSLAVQIDYGSPITWAIIVGWIITVILHEWAHGIVAYLGGDHTIRNRGGLSLNPLQYIHPLFSLILPALFMLMGGLPLVGGATYVRRDLLRSTAWKVGVSLAGPAMNFLIFVALSIPFHPKIGWVDVTAPVSASTSNVYLFLATLAQLQMMAVIINLFPLPPLDGFQAVSAFMDDRSRAMLMSPPVFVISLLILFAILDTSQAYDGVYHVTHQVQRALGFDADSMIYMGQAYNFALFGSP